MADASCMHSCAVACNLSIPVVKKHALVKEENLWLAHLPVEDMGYEQSGFERASSLS